jgi:hypothetical protein
MPIEAAVERRMQRHGRLVVGFSVQHVAGLVWIFLLDPLQGELGERRRLRLCHFAELLRCLRLRRPSQER